jgi:hypothetical protein
MVAFEAGQVFVGRKLNIHTKIIVVYFTNDGSYYNNIIIVRRSIPSDEAATIDKNKGIC